MVRDRRRDLGENYLHGKEQTNSKGLREKARFNSEWKQGWIFGWNNIGFKLVWQSKQRHKNNPLKAIHWPGKSLSLSLTLFSFYHLINHEFACVFIFWRHFVQLQRRRQLKREWKWRRCMGESGVLLCKLLLHSLATLAHLFTFTWALN